MSYSFIINPVSGSGNKADLVKQIERKMTLRKLSYSIHYSEFVGHSMELANELKHTPNTTIVAVGGDGTINEIGTQLLNSATPLGIIPLGSGNGLARHLKIPLQPIQALNVILDGQEQQIDAGIVNGNVFFVTCGLGFEAEVSHNFNRRNSRGLLGYVIEALKLFPRYSSELYKLRYNAKQTTVRAFSLTVANSSQYGNNAIIAREASVQDGLLDLCTVKSYPKLLGPCVGIRLFLKNVHKSQFYTTEKIKSVFIDIENEEKINAHVDGEAIEIQLPVEVMCMPNALKVLVPNNVV